MSDYFTSPIVQTAVFSYYLGLLTTIWGVFPLVTKWESYVSYFCLVTFLVHLLGFMIFGLLYPINHYQQALAFFCYVLCGLPFSKEIFS
jgi:uncharacterized membrane protein HdeD (DUF308 family)